MSLLEPQQHAPTFSLANQDSVPVTLQSLLGHRVLLWWYPKADTPG